MILKHKIRLSPKFDVVFIDETQDLSLMQWNMAKTVGKKQKILLLQVMMTKQYLDGQGS